MEATLELVAARVRSLRARHLAFAGVGMIGGLCALLLGVVLGEAQAPLGARLFFLAAGICFSVWQLVLAVRIGRGLRALQRGRVVTWIYVARAYVNGAHVASGVMLGLDSGERVELPIAPETNAQSVLDALVRGHPRATVGFDTAIEAKFTGNPRALLRA